LSTSLFQLAPGCLSILSVLFLQPLLSDASPDAATRALQNLDAYFLHFAMLPEGKLEKTQALNQQMDRAFNRSAHFDQKTKGGGAFGHGAVETNLVLEDQSKAGGGCEEPSSETGGDFVPRMGLKEWKTLLTALGLMPMFVSPLDMVCSVGVHRFVWWLYVCCS
jgi:hypothetical protein